MMDASTTAASLVPYLSQFQDIIVITNGAKTAYLLGHAGIQTISTGGRMIIESQALIGRDALETLQNYNADVCFFSCRALSPNGDFTDNSAELCEVRRKMMKQSRVKIFLCDSTKFNKSALVNFGNLSDADAVITDSALPESYNEYLRK